MKNIFYHFQRASINANKTNFLQGKDPTLSY